MMVKCDYCGKRITTRLTALHLKYCMPYKKRKLRESQLANQSEQIQLYDNPEQLNNNNEVETSVNETTELKDGNVKRSKRISKDR